MKAITLQPPWGNLLVDEFTNSVSINYLTHYRGPVLIHCSGKFDDEKNYQDLIVESRKIDVGNYVSFFDLWSIIGQADLVGCDKFILNEIYDKEDHWHLRFENIVNFCHNVPCKNKFGLWDVADTIIYDLRYENVFINSPNYK